MIEVEAKARISNPAPWKKKILKLGKYVGVEKKVDEYYTLESPFHYPKKSLRIRTMKGKAIVNFKHLLSYHHKVFAKQEVEFDLHDVSGFLALIHDFGYRLWLRKEKETWLYRITKNFHIELNKVKGLGWFIEVEYLCTPEKINGARKEVIEVMKRLGIPEKDFVKEGYTKLLWDQKN